MPRIPPRAPVAALQSMEITSGLRVDLAAAEPLIVDPVAMDIDELGRAFVLGMCGYSLASEERLGVVRMLLDDDGDGCYDRAIPFAEGLRAPTAILCWQQGILIGDAPDLLYLRDTNGDGRADVKAVLFTGFGTANIQQRLNSLQWGIDNRIYGAGGGNGANLQPVAKDLDSFGLRLPEWRPHASTELGLRDFMIHPLAGTCRPLTGGGQYGMTFDVWGNRYVCSNSDHCQQIVHDDRRDAANPLAQIGAMRINIAADGPAAPIFRASDVEPWRLLRTRLRVQGLAAGPIEGGGRASGYFSGATGIFYYDGHALPAEYRGQLFIGDVGSNLVHRKRLIDDGIVKSAVRADAGREFLRSSDQWFRPVAFSVAPDGALLVLDMYREVVEHPLSLPDSIRRHLDLASGRDRGRLYRVVPQEFRAREVVFPGLVEPAVWVDMLGHENGWHRRTAARLLHQHRLAGTAEFLRRVGLSAPRPDTRIRAMYLLADFDELPLPQLVALMRDEAPYVRLHALRVSERFDDGRLWPERARLSRDHDERVRHQLAWSLAALRHQEAIPILVELAISQPANPWMDIALGQACHQRQLPVLRGILERRRVSPSSDVNGRVVRELLRQVTAESLDGPLHELAQLLFDVASADETWLVEWLAGIGKAPPPAVERFVQCCVQRDLPWQAIIERGVSQAQSTVRDPGAALADRAVSIEVLGWLPDDQFAPFIPELLGLDGNPDLKGHVLHVAARYDSDEVAESLLNVLAEVNPQLRSQILGVLTSRPRATRLLIGRLETGGIPAALLDAATRQRLQTHPHAEIRDKALTVLAPKTRGHRADLVADYERHLRQMSGDAERGRQLFRHLCQACHRLEGVGHDVGPSLNGAGYRDDTALLVSILDPNREVDSRYLSYLLLLRDGRLLHGSISSETEAALILVASDGQSQSIARQDIEQMRSTELSLMPENFDQELSPGAMADLLAYLRSIVD